MTTGRTPRVLTIAGSDSGGGAGVQADLKAFARCGVHGMCALTAVTAQSTVAVDAVQAVAPELIEAQVSSVAHDIGVDAVKIGMLGSVATVQAVARALAGLGGAVPVVLDPVMVAESGGRLLDDDARDALLELLLPRATVVTPNLPEARALAGAQEGEDDAVALAHAVLALGPGAVVVTGGHRERAHDVFCDAARTEEIAGERWPEGAAHGSGCTHASALAAHLALGFEVLEAARRARRIAGEAVRDGLRDVGAGAGPVDVIGLAAMRAAIAGP